MISVATSFYRSQQQGWPRADLAAVVSVLLHMLSAGCPWRDLPCEDVHWRTVYGYFMRWRDNGV